MQLHPCAALKIFAIYIILRHVCLAQRHTSLLSASASPSTTQTILNDIRNAFKVITNNTSVLNRLIPNMYQPAMQQPNSVFIFKIPTDLNSMDSASAVSVEDMAAGYSMWSMQRSEFVEPTFPNLTVQHMYAQLKKRRRQHSTPDFNLRKQQTTAKNGKEQAGQHNDWSMLGLDGWTGVIAPAADTGNFSQKPSVDSAYPIGDILMDFGEAADSPPPGAEGSAASNDATAEVGEVQENAKANDSDIYLARVNDPFGNSVKWELRNTSSPSGSDDRSKRDVLKLYSMIQCSTGCNPLTYKAYGCFCGFLGAGLPVDGIDRCCKLHDKCYEHKCAARLCYCDLRLSRCLRQFVCPQQRAVCTTSTARRLQNLLTL